MATKSVILKQLLIVVWHSYQIELDHIVLTANPCWVDVSVDQALFVQVSDCMTKLTKVEHNLSGREWPLAERLPVLDVVWGFQLEQDYALLHR